MLGVDLMRKLTTSLAFVAALSGSTLQARAADMPVKAPPPAQPPSCFSSAASYFEASPVECPLSWNGITLYGDIDMGAGYQSHGVLFNAHYPNGVEELISKNSNGWRYTLLPNGLGQSHIGVKVSNRSATTGPSYSICRPALTLTACSLPTDEIAGSEQYQSARCSKRQQRFQPRRPDLQHGRLRGREQSDVRNADGGPAGFTHPGWPRRL